MSSLNSGSQLFNVINENQLTSILSHYSSEFVLSVVDQAIVSRFNTNNVLKQPNVVAAWEQNFKQMLADFEDSASSKQQIMQVREDTYKEIILRICNEFKLNFTIDENVDMYSAAYYLYDFFVSNFNINLITFFSNYIYKERAGIYESMNLAEFKKNKDSSTLYGKKMYKDIKIAVINANIDYVVSNLCGIDINLADVFNVVYTQRDLAMYMSTLVTSQGDFFKEFYASMMNTSIKPILLTEIRFAIQAFAMAHEPSISDEEDIEE